MWTVEDLREGLQSSVEREQLMAAQMLVVLLWEEEDTDALAPLVWEELAQADWPARSLALQLPWTRLHPFASAVRLVESFVRVEAPQELCSVAISQLAEWGPASACTLPTLLDFYHHTPLDFFKTHILQALTAIRCEPSDILPFLCQELDSDDLAVLVFVLAVLAVYKEDAAPALPRLLELASHSVLDIRLAALRALGRMGSRAKEAVPLLESMAEEPDRTLQVHVASALIQIGGQAEPWVTRIRDILFADTDRCSFQHWEFAILALADLGERAASAVSDLLALLQREPESAGPMCLHALASIGQRPDEVIQVAEALLDAESLALREQAAEALRGWAHHESLPAERLLERLASVLDDDLDTAVQLCAILADAGEAVAPFVPRLLTLLARSTDWTTQGLLLILGQTGAASTDVVTALQTATSHARPEIRNEALLALLRLDAVEDEWPALLRLLRLQSAALPAASREQRALLWSDLEAAVAGLRAWLQEQLVTMEEPTDREQPSTATLESAIVREGEALLRALEEVRAFPMPAFAQPLLPDDLHDVLRLFLNDLQHRRSPELSDLWEDAMFS